MKYLYTLLNGKWSCACLYNEWFDACCQCAELCFERRRTTQTRTMKRLTATIMPTCKKTCQAQIR